MKNSKLVFKNDNFSIVEIEKSVGGKTLKLSYLRRPTVAISIPITRNGDIVFIRQYRAATDSYILELPAGKCAEGENPEDAISRELVEEAGFVTNRSQLLGDYYASPHYSDERIYIYKCYGDIVNEGSPTEKELILSPVLLSSNDAWNLICNGEIKDMKSILALSFLNKVDTI